MNLYALFKNTVAKYPEKPAIVEGGTVLSYQALEGVVSGIAEDLKALGVAPGQMIGLCFPNSIAYIAITYALWKLDAVVVPIDIELKQDEIKQVCVQMRIAAMIDHRPGDSEWTRQKCPDIDTPYCFRPMAAPPRHETAIHAAFVRFTSGTTGARKGVVLSHERIFERIQSVNRVLQVTSEDRVLWILPMSHHFVSTIVLYLANGATVILAAGMWSRPILETINRHYVTLLYASPFHYTLLAADVSGQMMPDVRLAISTTIGLPVDIHERFYRRFHLPLSQAYGIIEVGLVCINTGNPLMKPGSVGQVSPDYRIRIDNRHAYCEMGDGTCGELFFSGPGFFDAYFHPWTDGEDVMADGWFETGDIGGLDEDGYLYLHGRKNHVINTAGIKVYPWEIEAELNRHPAVAESCVYGKKDERFGHVVAARVVLNDSGETVDESALKGFCRERLAAYKVPGEICFTDRIEKTRVTGKVIR